MIKELNTLLKEFLNIKGGTFAIGNDYSVGEMKIGQKPEYIMVGDVAHISSKKWTIHIDLVKVKSVKFIKQKEPSGTIPYILYASLKDKKDYSIISYFFPNPYLNKDGDVTEFNEKNLNMFEKIKNKYLDRKFFLYEEKK